MALKVAIKFPGGMPSRIATAKQTKKIVRTTTKKNRKNGAKNKILSKNSPKKMKGLKIPASFDITRRAFVVLERLVQLSDGRYTLPHKHQDQVDSGSVTTRIPSTVLENLGIMTPTPNSSPRHGYPSPVKMMAAISSPHSEPDEAEVGIGIVVLPDPLETCSPTKQPNTSPAKSFLSSIDLPHGSLENESRTSTPRPTFQFELAKLAQDSCASHGTVARLSFSPLPFDAPPVSSDAQDLVISNCDYAFALGERLLKMPPRSNLENLETGNPVIRRLAPYALKVFPTQELFFPYVAVRSKVNDMYHCIVVDQFEQSLVAYGGHFVVNADRLYDPAAKTPVSSEVVLTSVDNLRVHLTLFGVPNKKLLGLPGYFLEPKDEDHAEELINSVDGILAIVDQVRLREHFDVEQRLRNHSRTLSEGRYSLPQSSVKRKRLD